MPNKVLIVTMKNHELQKTLSTLCEEQGLPVDATDKFLTALSFLSRRRYAYIIIELLPPSQRAVKILNLLKAVSGGVVVALLRGEGDLAHSRCWELADHCLMLPPDPVALRALVKEWSETAASESPATIRGPDKEFFHCRGLVIVPQYRWVYFDYNYICLTPKEYDLLWCLAKRSNQIIHKEQILAEVWHHAFLGDDHTINAHILRLRKKIAAYTDEVFIETVWRLGYRFVTESPTKPS